MDIASIFGINSGKFRSDRKFVDNAGMSLLETIRQDAASQFHPYNGIYRPKQELLPCLFSHVDRETSLRLMDEYSLDPKVLFLLDYIIDLNPEKSSEILSEFNCVQDYSRLQDFFSAKLRPIKQVSPRKKELLIQEADRRILSNISGMNKEHYPEISAAYLSLFGPGESWSTIAGMTNLSDIKAIAGMDYLSSRDTLFFSNRKNLVSYDISMDGTRYNMERWGDRSENYRIYIPR